MNVLITGSSGYIGRDFLSHFKINHPDSTIYLLQKNKILDNQENTIIINKDIRYLLANDLDVEFDYVYHFAALAHNKFTNDDINDVNVNGTLALIHAIDGKCKNFIFLSSANIYGSVGDGLCEKSPLKATTPMMLAKQKCEEIIMCSSIHNIFILRLALVLSHDAPGNIKLISNFSKKFSILPFGAAIEERSFLNKPDLIQLLTDLPDKTINGKNVYNIASREGLSLRELISAFLNLCGLKPTFFYVPISIIYFIFYALGKKELFNKMFKKFTLNTSKAEAELGFSSTKIILRK